MSACWSWQDSRERVLRIVIHVSESQKCWGGGHSSFRLLPSVVIYTPSDASEPKEGRQYIKPEAETSEDQRRELVVLGWEAGRSKPGWQLKGLLCINDSRALPSVHTVLRAQAPSHMRFPCFSMTEKSTQMEWACVCGRELWGYG